MRNTVVLRRDYLHYIRKYNRFEKRHANLPAHLTPAFGRTRVGDIVTVGQCRPISKTVRFNVVRVEKQRIEGNVRKTFCMFWASWWQLRKRKNWVDGSKQNDWLTLEDLSTCPPSCLLISIQLTKHSKEYKETVRLLCVDLLYLDILGPCMHTFHLLGLQRCFIASKNSLGGCVLLVWNIKFAMNLIIFLIFNNHINIQKQKCPIQIFFNLDGMFFSFEIIFDIKHVLKSLDIFIYC